MLTANALCRNNAKLKNAHRAHVFAEGTKLVEKMIEWNIKVHSQMLGRAQLLENECENVAMQRKHKRL